MDHKKRISVTLALMLLMESFVLAGLGSRKAQYVGGTTSLKENVEGVLSAGYSTMLVFAGDRGESLLIPYKKITGLAYGQHAGKHVSATNPWGVATRGVEAIPIIRSKMRRHYLTISFTEEHGKEEAAVFQLGKEITRSMLSSLQARTGKKVEYEDEEARKAGSK